MFFVKQLIWDAGNVDHMARHQVTPEEVEEVCGQTFLAFESYKGRFLIIGPTQAERMLAIVLDPEPEEGIYYPVMARSADNKERRLYQAEKGGGNQDD
jgi:uncharacterized DUF497 family protein